MFAVTTARKTFLVTGARAPAALDIIRRLGRAGHDVLAADCVHAPMSRFSRHLRRYFRVPGPRVDSTGFITALHRITLDEKVDVLLPACEEIYCVSRHRPTFTEGCDVFCSEFDLLETLHHKERFARLTQQHGGPIVAPESLLVEDAARLRAFMPESRRWVFKPVYSRFASRTLIGPPPAKLTRLAFDPTNPWLAQRYVAGRELSSYSVVVRGRVTAHALYHSRHRAGLAAGIYFVPEDNASVREFVEQFVARLEFTGQIAFDFIVCSATGRVFVLECNPRATSGVHLLPPDLDLAGALTGVNDPFEGTPANGRAKMLGAAMFYSGFGAAVRARRTNEWRRDFAVADDVVFTCDDRLPALAQFVFFAEMVGVSLRRRMGVTAAMTADIEWNG